MASRENSAKRDEIVVFSIARDSACSECGAELWKGEFLRMEGDRPLRLACADLDRLVFLPSGDAAIARHACAKYSGGVGRSAQAKRFEASAVDLAVRAHVRHEHTDYDERLACGGDRRESRAEVAPRVERILGGWRGAAAE